MIVMIVMTVAKPNSSGSTPKEIAQHYILLK